MNQASSAFSSVNQPSAYERDITIAKGMGIFLVVMGHILARGHSEGNDWFTSLTQIIYLFHMPFFMFLSGLVFFKPGRAERLWQNYGTHAGKQVFRLLIPFLGLGLLVIFAKYAASGILHVDNMPESPLTGMANLIWHTKYSPAQFIWYVFVLFIYTLIVPPVMKGLRVSMAGLLVAALIIHFVPPVPYFYLDLLTYFLMFFILGGMARHYYPQYRKWVERYGWIAFLICLASLAVYWTDLDTRYQKLLAGTCCLPGLHWLAIQLAQRGNRFFECLGEYTYSIYLFNTLSIGVVKGILFRFTHWNDWHFFLVMPVLLAAGLLIPILLRRWVLSRIPYINRMTA